MAFVHRKLYRQKPRAWGPVSAVQASIFKNAERAGIDLGYIQLCYPFWEGAGLVFKDYSQSLADMQIYNLQTAYPKWKSNSGYLYADKGDRKSVV